MPKFSIIIPLYNKETYIEKTILSVLHQTFSDWELIIVNDGSTDSSLEVLQTISYNDTKFSLNRTVPLVTNLLHCVKYELIKDKIYVIDQLNKGESAARNNGIKESVGQFITFIDADDWWITTFLEEMNNLITLYPNNGIWSSTHYNYRYGKAIECKVKGLSKDFIHGEINYASIAKYLNKPICVGSVVLNKNICLLENGFNENIKLGPDFDLFFRIAMRHGMVLLAKPLMFYNNDVDFTTRAAGKRIYKKEENIVFNFDYPDLYEKEDVSYLLDYIRIKALFKYYIYGQYSEEINSIFNQINWSKYPKKYYFRYKILPRCILKYLYKYQVFLSKIKQILIKWSKK